MTSATLTAKAGDRVIGVNRAGAVTITLPTAEVRKGRTYTVKDESGAASTDKITVAAEGSETIDGAATDTISTNYGSVTYYSDGTNWFTVPLLAAASHTLASHSAKAHSDLTGVGTGDHHTEAHQAAHNSGGADALKLDDLAAPDDNTDLNFSTTAHGLVPKGPNDGTFLKADGTWAAAGGGLSNVVEDTTPQLGGDLDANGSDITGIGHVGFLATQDPSAGANDLDDYEEGTFTPGIADDTSNGSSESQTYSTQVGIYTKIGNTVIFHLVVTWTSYGSFTTSEGLRVVGLPFTSRNLASSESAITALGDSLSLGTAGYGLSGTVAVNLTYIGMSLNDGTGGYSPLLVSEASTTGTLRISGQYQL